jgi:hypothetical protein
MLLEQKKIKLLNKWHLVQNETEVMHAACLKNAVNIVVV